MHTCWVVPRAVLVHKAVLHTYIVFIWKKFYNRTHKATASYCLMVRRQARGPSTAQLILIIDP